MSLLVLVAWSMAAVAEQPVSDADSAASPAPMFMTDVNRHAEYRAAPPDEQCPIPNLPVTRDTYFKWLEFSRHLRYADDPASHGNYGPRHFLPVLAKYVQSGERKYGLACLRMLGQFDEAVRQDTEEDGWHEMFGAELPYLGLYRGCLANGGLMATDDPGFRDMVLHFARTLHPWATPATHWRGPMHRSQGEGVARGLVARWFPDIPEATEWREYSETVYQDWWRFRDFPQNDTGYLFLSLMPLFLQAWMTGQDEFFTDPGMKPLWDRLVHEVSPDGSVAPYGAHGGWNSMAGTRIAMLEMLAAKTRDGTYRFVAHRLMNYLVYQRSRYREDHLLAGIDTTEPLALAYLFADDTVEPVVPAAGSRVLGRKETLRFPGFDKAGPARILGPLDPDPNRHFVDCGLVVTGEEKPSKLVLRSGWKPGDLFVLVDLFPRHDPLNTLGILGITRWGAALTTAISAKDWSDENRVLVEPIDGGDSRPRVPPPETLVTAFDDSPGVTYSSVQVTNYGGMPVTCVRHFLFVKNRFLFIRDDLTAAAPLRVKLASIFNTQNIGPALSSHAALTYMSQPVAHVTGLLNPPVDLLVYHCPQKDMTLSVVDRSIKDRRAWTVPAQLRYGWQGQLRPDSPVHFATLLRPQAPTRDLVSAGGATPTKDDGRLPLVTDDIEVLRDDATATVVRVGGGGDEAYWLVLNPAGRAISQDDLRTSARAAVVARDAAGDVRTWSLDAVAVDVGSPSAEGARQ